MVTIDRRHQAIERYPYKLVVSSIAVFPKGDTCSRVISEVDKTHESGVIILH